MKLRVDGILKKSKNAERGKYRSFLVDCLVSSALFLRKAKISSVGIAIISIFLNN
jgi:hypothetical protein